MDTTGISDGKRFVYTVDELLKLKDNEINIELSISDFGQSEDSFDGENRHKKVGLGKNRFSSLAPDSALDSRFAGPARNTEPGLDFADQEVAGDKDLAPPPLFKFQSRQKSDDGRSGDSGWPSGSYASTSCRPRSDAIGSWRSQNQKLNSLWKPSALGYQDNLSSELTMSLRMRGNDRGALTAPKESAPWLEDDDASEPICLSTLRFPAELELRRGTLPDKKDTENEAAREEATGVPFFDNDRIFETRMRSDGVERESAAHPWMKAKQPLPAGNASVEQINSNDTHSRPPVTRSSKAYGAQTLTEFGLSVPISSIFGKPLDRSDDGTTGAYKPTDRIPLDKATIPETELIARIKKSSLPLPPHYVKQKSLTESTPPPHLYDHVDSLGASQSAVQNLFPPCPPDCRPFHPDGPGYFVPQQSISLCDIFNRGPSSLTQQSFIPPYNYYAPFYPNTCIQPTNAFGFHSTHIPPNPGFLSAPAVDHNAPEKRLVGDHNRRPRKGFYYEPFDTNDTFDNTGSSW